MSETAHAVSRTRLLSGKQIMSILGIVPIGVYVVAHLWTNMYAIAGPEAFDRRLEESRQGPWFVLLEIFGLGVPILIHMGYGLRIIFKGRPNIKHYPTLRNLKFGLQRLSGAGILLFLFAHVIKARIMPAFDSANTLHHETWAGMHEALSEPLTFTVYLLGLLGVSYHLANGVWGSALTLGLTVTPAAQKRMEWVSAIVFAALLFMSALSLYGFHPFSTAV
jgi:succinate dehydrogenase / fumarate reductase cytochrome b subunit